MLNKNLKKIVYILSVVVLIAIPLVTFGAEGLEGLIDKINNVLKAVVPLLIALAVVFFLWGVLKFVTAGGDEEKRAQGRDTMIYGIIAIFVMVSVWGLVKILEDTFKVGNKPVPAVPKLPKK